MIRFLKLTFFWLMGLLAFALFILPWILAWPGETVVVIAVLTFAFLVIAMWYGRERKDWRSLFY